MRTTGEKIPMAWATDVHLDFLKTDEAVLEWIEDCVKPIPGDILLLTGDISLAPSILHHLRMIEKHSKKHIYFVAGNHDYWDGSFDELRSEFRKLEPLTDGITWMGAVDFVPVGETMALVGHDGWYDARNGDLANSRFCMNDWYRIKEFAAHPDRIVDISRHLADEATNHVVAGVEKAISAGKTKIVVMTHFPTHPEACRYKGGPSEPTALPWYSSKVMGDALERLAEENPRVTINVLCGHTHSAASFEKRSNLRIIVGKAEYGDPVVNTIGAHT
jgi:predicted phosphohydrolase